MRGSPSRQLLALLLACSAPVAGASTMGPATIVFDLVWGFSTAAAGLSGCNEIRVDAIGDLARSAKFAIYGSLSCPDLGGGLNVDGSGYIGVDGSLNASLRIGVGTILACPRLPSLSGSCQLYTAVGQPLGSAQLTLR